MKYCQGTRCHTYDTKDRKKGSKDNKRNETRKRTDFLLWSMEISVLYNCQTDWFNTHGDNAINHFGRVEQPIVLTEDNAWNRRYNYHRWHDNQDTIQQQSVPSIRNMITRATR